MYSHNTVFVMQGNVTAPKSANFKIDLAGSNTHKVMERIHTLILFPYSVYNGYNIHI